MFEPTLPQMLFGNATSEYDLGRNETLVADELYDLSQTLAEKNPDAQAHGFLGGEFGYGQDFTNDVFEMHPYWWGDCQCGYEESEMEWESDHPHDPACWQERWGHEHTRVLVLGLAYDEMQRLMREWEVANGWDGRPGVAVFCDCGQDDLWQKWVSTHHHDPSCGEVRPNFRCGDVEVRWYKYIGRGMSTNSELSRDEWRGVFAVCRASL